MAVQALQVLEVPLDQAVLLENLVQVAILAPLVHQAHVATEVNLDLRVHLVMPVHQDLLVNLELLAHAVVVVLRSRVSVVRKGNSIMETSLMTKSP